MDTYEDKLFALEDGSGQVVTFKQNTSGDFEEEKRKAIDTYKSNFRNTLRVTKKGIFVGLWDNNSVVKITICENDFVLQEIIADSFSHPMLCTGYPQGGILIADCHNSRVVTMGDNGRIENVDIEKLGRYPVGVVQRKGMLFVLLINKTLQLFTLKYREGNHRKSLGIALATRIIPCYTLNTHSATGVSDPLPDLRLELNGEARVDNKGDMLNGVTGVLKTMS